ncbi:hypothetical protein Gogos_020649 [Gossypium gossypioides]|uniref:DUF7745 domain-containing protein n=1 Tax=Gossypium gossypioides TaxID=34282 RepID=A0A7J9D1X3_GOSGO|nr:hypothetical protein [Gossypium gossypioides]
MEMRFLDKIEDNVAVRMWAETIWREKGDSLAEGYVSELWDFTRISVIQNDLQEMKEIWDQWDDETKQLFYCDYGDLPYRLSVKVDKHLFRALAQFWNPAYSCFIFGKVDLVPTVEEYTTLLRCPKIQVAARIQQKGDSKCIFWKSLRDLVLVHPDVKKRVDVFALGIYGLVILPKSLGHIDEAVSDLFDRLSKGVTPIPAILAETFRSLSACRRAGEGRFIGCTQLLLELVATPRRDDITEEKCMTILQNLQEDDVEWKAPWMVPDEIRYRCGDFDWVPLLGIWGAVGYTLLLVLRQYRSRQFIPATQGLAQCEFSYKDENYKRKIREISNAWKKVHRMKRFTVGAMTTPEYYGWWSKRVNDNIPGLREDCVQSIEEYLQVAPSELEIIK